MTDTIDQALDILSNAALPAASVTIERSVMARFDAIVLSREARPTLGGGLGAAAAAMIIGIVFVNVTPVSTKMPVELSVFSAHSAFAPATLLATEG